jgi:hypothetical protein
MTTKLIQLAFRATGIHLLNRNIFKPIDFAPSKSFSATAPTPLSYPAEVPLSPAAIPTDNKLTDTDTGDTTDRDADEDVEMVINFNEGSDDEDLDFIPCEPDEDSDTETHSPSTQITRSSSLGTLGNSRDSSVVVSVDAFLRRVQDPASQMTRDEMAVELRKLCFKSKLLENEVSSLQAQLTASNAHCTIMTRAASEAQSELATNRKKTRRSVKTKSRFVTHPELKEAFEAEKAEKAAQAKEAAEKEAEKAVQEAARVSRIQEETVSKNFTGGLSSFKKKDDLIILAGALGLETDGTIPILTARIRTHLDEHPELAQSQRFAGLFVRQRHAARGCGSADGAPTAES